MAEKEDAVFETEISEDDVPGEWKLKGEVLTRSPVRLDGLVLSQRHISLKACISTFRFSLSLLFIYKCTVMYSLGMRHSNGGCGAQAHAEKLPVGSGRRSVLPSSERYNQRNAQCQR